MIWNIYVCGAPPIPVRPCNVCFSKLKEINLGEIETLIKIKPTSAACQLDPIPTSLMISALLN